MKKIKKIWFLLLFFFLITCFSNCLAAERKLPWVKIITRAERWADESIRLFTYNPRKSSSNTNQTEAQKEAAKKSQIRNERMAKNYPNDRKYASSQTMSGNFYLLYPNYWNHNKTKIIIHHTAMDYNTNRTIEDVKAQIQYIYKYHTIDRDFWDIWYNFIIDQMWNIYEWRSGGEWAIWMHAANNNASSIWIALMWNFEKTYPTDAQLFALVNLATALSSYYNIDPYAYTQTFYLTSTNPYVAAKTNLKIMWHKDAWSTACPWKNLYSLLPKFRKEVFYRRQNKVVWEQPLPFNRYWNNISTTWQNSTASQVQTNNQKQQTIKITNSNTQKINSVLNLLKSAFENQSWENEFKVKFINLKNTNPEILKTMNSEIRKLFDWNLTTANSQISKISYKINKDEAKTLLEQDISVLLYELSTKFDKYDIKCTDECIISIDWKVLKTQKATITKLRDNFMVKTDRWYPWVDIEIKSSNKEWVVEITNYDRKSYVWIPWNSFKWSLIFVIWKYPESINWKQKSWLIIINKLPFEEYMKWIVETNDTETLEKNKVMAMITKNYALFYLNWKNQHPNIEKWQSYQAIDDANFYQKYVWAWLEKTLKKRYQALEETKNQIVTYNWNLAILPYFNCSVWFTLSAEEKRWRNDTPYLKSVIDLEVCGDFKWHWVWLAWQWAEWFAKNWLNYKEILNYYYDWIEIEKI